MSELQGLQTRIDDLREAGARVIAISPDTPDQNATVAESLGLSFPILSDADLEATSAFRLRHETSSPSAQKVIPRPATYIVGDDGTVKWRDLTENWRVRPQPDDLLAALQATKG